MIKTSNLTVIKDTHISPKMLKYLEATIRPTDLSSARKVALKSVYGSKSIMISISIRWSRQCYQAWCQNTHTQMDYYTLVYYSAISNRIQWQRLRGPAGFNFILLMLPLTDYDSFNLIFIFCFYTALPGRTHTHTIFRASGVYCFLRFTSVHFIII
jgi:hypothetical protein